MANLEKSFIRDASIVMSIASNIGLPVPMPEDLESEGETFFWIAMCAIWLLKRALNGKEDAEYILSLWNQEEEKIRQLNS